MRLDDIPRVPIAHLPTPIAELPRLSRALGGPSLWIKRDDLTGLAFGGNKVRKLEFFLAEALHEGADTLVTTGALQSNHARQTAAAAAQFGLGCALLLMGQPPQDANGNLLLDQLLGAEIHWHGGPPSERDAALEALVDQLRSQGRRPYLVPHGGSNRVGALGYILALRELLEQSRRVGLRLDALVVATSSGGTQTGLLLGSMLFGYQGRIVGISVGPAREIVLERLAHISQRANQRWELDLNLEPDRWEVHDDYIDGGYAVLSSREKEAIRLTAQHEGILLDPVYTGRAMAGLTDLIRRGEFARNQNVLLWHTGGTPALFAYSIALLAP